MKFDGMKVFLFIVCFFAIIGGAIAMFEDPGASGGALAGGALIAMAILHHAEEKA
jgi:hypothetical protein